MCGEQDDTYKDKSDVSNFTTNTNSTITTDDNASSTTAGSSRRSFFLQKIKELQRQLVALLQLRLQKMFPAKQPTTESSNPPLPQAALPITRDLFLEVQGEDVAQLQRFLKEKGYYTYPEITGYYGEVTKAAVAKFQEDNGVPPLGGVGPETRSLLNSLMQ